MIMLVIEFGGLHILQWLVSGLIPLLMLVLSLVYLLMARAAVKKGRLAHQHLDESTQDLQGRTMKNMNMIRQIVQSSPLPLLPVRFSLMEKDSELLHQGRWLPDPGLYLSPEQLLKAAEASSLSLRPAGRVLSIGILGTLTSLLLQQQYPPTAPVPILALILAPGLTGLAFALILAGEAYYGRKYFADIYHEIRRILERCLPVFADQAGMSLLIDQFMVYDRQMHESLQAFTQTAHRLAESDMAEGIRRSVEQVLLDSVAPSIQESSLLLKDLAENLNQRQEEGMQQLAGQFASALASDMARHLQPVNKELTQMTSLMADVKDYIDYAMRALETVRQESDILLQDARSSLQQLADARTTFSEDFSQAAGQLEQLTSATSHMAAIQQGNESGLAAAITQLSEQMERHSANLKQVLDETVIHMQEASLSASSQQVSAGEYISQIEQQVNKLNQELTSAISQLLEQVGQETAAVARHTADIGARLGTLNETLSQSLDDFSQDSAQYVKQTLGEFDSSLAELVRRMTQATIEIRDAVDALPAVLQQRPRYDS